MAKESYYFPHDYDAQNDPKLQALISEFKAEGYGIYWAIIEMLHKESDHKLPFKEYVFLAIAKQMLANAEQIKILLNYAIDECDLFEKKDGFFFSKRVLRNFEIRAKISQKRSIAGQKGAIAKQLLASKQANSSKGKEKKGKEIKDLKEREEKHPTHQKNSLWQNVFLSNPGLVEQNFVDELIKKFGEEKTKKILYDFREKNFKAIRTMKEALDEKGNIKPIEDRNGINNSSDEFSVKSRLGYKFDSEKAEQRLTEIEEEYPELR